MRRINAFASLLFDTILVVAGAVSYVTFRANQAVASAWIAAAGILFAVILARAVNVADPWQRVVVLRLGNFRTLKGPGLFFIVPVFDTTPYWIDTRVILGDSERQVAEKFEEAALTYAANPFAFHLRAMNMLYEGLKQNATMVVVPSTALESMQLGTTPGLFTGAGIARLATPNGEKEVAPQG